MEEVINKYVNQFASTLSKYWLLIINLILVLFVLPIFAAPYLLSSGQTTLAEIIYRLYHLTCHQLPERSLFVFGFRTAVCARCLAIYLSFFAGGLFYIILPTKPYKFKVYLIFALPIIIDGALQLTSLHPSNNQLRLLTGAIFGVSTSLFVCPHLKKIFAQVSSYAKMTKQSQIEPRPAKEDSVPC